MTSCIHSSSLLPCARGLACAFFIQSVLAEPTIHPVSTPELTAGQVHIEADNIDGQLNTEITAHGNVVVKKDTQTLFSEWSTYSQKQNRIRAGDHFTLIQPNNQIDGTFLDYYIDSHTGIADAPHFSGRKKQHEFHGQGTKGEFTGVDQYRIYDATATTCSPNNDAWYLKSSRLDLDYTRNVGIARHATLIFHGVPIAYTPWIDFPLNEGRKSGLLTPSLSSGSNGTELAVPYYWNIAPNYDATLTPHYNTKHGPSLGTEFRYLQPNLSGSLYTEQLPHDMVTDQYRYLWSGQHQQSLAPGLSIGYNATKVSDNAYFRDFGSRADIAANVNLLREARITHQLGWQGGSVNTSIKAQRYQTLQDPANPSITPPYATLPQLAVTATQALPWKLSSALASELSSFSHPTLQEGNRFVAYPTIAWGRETSWGFIRPRFGFHHTQYNLAPFSGSPARTATRTLPILSVDSGLFLERETSVFHRDYLHTLEPRLYYVYIPTRAQNQLPNFDSSENDFGFAQLFTENRFSGSDRINGANQVSAALTSRLIDHATGLETLRVAVGQRFHFQTSDITLAGTEIDHKHLGTNTLFSLGGNLTSSWQIDNLYQYNNDLARTERYSMLARYKPKPGHILSMRYFYGRNEPITSITRGYVHQIDIGAQWPIARNWYIVVRDNYSLVDRTHLEKLAGLEYNANCWTLRLVGQRYVADTLSTKTAWFLQLELKGIGGLGNNPLNTLRLAIPGYSSVNSIQSPPL